jgi:DNA-binding XRE family transcriptional regulator
MPTGYPKNGKRMPRATLVSEQTKNLLASMAELEERLAVLKRKDSAMSKLVTFVKKNDLSPADLREVARRLGEREVGDAPVTSQHIGKAKRIALGRKIKEAREAKGLQGTQLGKMVGAKGTAAVAQWEKGMIPSLPKYRSALIRVLGLPKNFFADMPQRNGAHP